MFITTAFIIYTIFYNNIVYKNHKAQIYQILEKD